MISTMTQDDLAHHARAILQASLYLTLIFRGWGEWSYRNQSC